MYIFSTGNSWADRVKGIVPPSPVSPNLDHPETPDDQEGFVPTLPSPPEPHQNGLSASEPDTDGSTTMEGR